MRSRSRGRRRSVDKGTCGPGMQPRKTITPGRRRCKEMRKAPSGAPISRGVRESLAVRDPVHVRKRLAQVCALVTLWVKHRAKVRAICKCPAKLLGKLMPKRSDSDPAGGGFFGSHRSRTLRARVSCFSGDLGLGFCGLLLRENGFLKGEAAHGGRLGFWRLWSSIYSFTVRGSESLKLRADSVVS